MSLHGKKNIAFKPRNEKPASRRQTGSASNSTRISRQLAQDAH